MTRHRLARIDRIQRSVIRNEPQKRAKKVGKRQAGILKTILNALLKQDAREENTDTLVIAAITR